MRELKFGVEIEFFGANYTTVIEQLRANGIQVAEFAGYTHAVIPKWKITTDCSVTSTGTGLTKGLELVSPILYGDEGLDELEKIKDTKVRLMRNQNYKECILEHLKFSGLDDKSFFNAWIDLYGYLEVCNMSWIMGLNTGPSDYAMHNENGINFLNPRVTQNSVSEPGEESPDLRLGKNTFIT